MDVIDNYEVITYKHGDQFKYDTPYFILPDGSVKLCKKGKLFDGRNQRTMTVYYKNGICHRDNDEPAVIFEKFNNYKQDYIYVKNGMIHRHQYPAVFISKQDKMEIDDKQSDETYEYLCQRNMFEGKCHYFTEGKHIRTQIFCVVN